MTQKIFITRDKQDGWWQAHGQGLLRYTKHIPSVELIAQGIRFADAYKDDVGDTLRTAGSELVFGTLPNDATPQPPRNVHGPVHWRYVNNDKASDVIDLPEGAPGGHWENEAGTCLQCNPAHAAAKNDLRARTLAEIRKALQDKGIPRD